MLKQHYQPVTSLKFTPCGSVLVSGAEDGLVLRWNISDVIDALKISDTPDPHLKLGQHSDKVNIFNKLSSNRNHMTTMVGKLVNK